MSQETMDEIVREFHRDVQTALEGLGRADRRSALDEFNKKLAEALRDLGPGIQPIVDEFQRKIQAAMGGISMTHGDHTIQVGASSTESVVTVNVGAIDSAWSGEYTIETGRTRSDNKPSATVTHHNKQLRRRARRRGRS